MFYGMKTVSLHILTVMFPLKNSTHILNIVWQKQLNFFSLSSSWKLYSITFSFHHFTHRQAGSCRGHSGSVTCQTAGCFGWTRHDRSTLSPSSPESRVTFTSCSGGSCTTLKVILEKMWFPSRLHQNLFEAEEGTAADLKLRWTKFSHNTPKKSHTTEERGSWCFDHRREKASKSRNTDYYYHIKCDVEFESSCQQKKPERIIFLRPLLVLLNLYICS